MFSYSGVQKSWSIAVLKFLVTGSLYTLKKYGGCQRVFVIRWVILIFPGGGNGNPLQYSCLENPLDRGAWQALVHEVAQSQILLKQLNMHTLIFYTIEIITKNKFNTY